MQRSYLDYAMSVIVGRALPRRAGRPQAGAPASPVRDVRRRLPPRPQLRQVRPRRRRRDGQLPPARRLGDLRRAGPAGPAVVAALPADRRAGQLRLAAATTRPPRCGTPSAGSSPLAMEMLRDIDEDTVDFVRQLRRQDPGAGRPAVAGSRTCWSTAARASRSAWPPTSRRTTCARSAPASSGRWTTRRPPTRSCSTRCMERIKGPDFPTAGLIVGRDGIEEAYRTGRGSIRMRAVVEVEEDAKGRTILVVTELPYQVNPDNLIESIAEPAPRRQARRHRRHQRRVAPTASACASSSRSSATPSPRSC